MTIDGVPFGCYVWCTTQAIEGGYISPALCHHCGLIALVLWGSPAVTRRGDVDSQKEPTRALNHVAPLLPGRRRCLADDARPGTLHRPALRETDHQSR
mgnify:CR=1 FL=1